MCVISVWNNRVNSCCYTSEHRTSTKQCQVNLLHLSPWVPPSLSHCFSFLFYLFLPSLSRYFFPKLSMGVPIDNFIVYGVGIYLFMSSEAENQSEFQITVWPTVTESSSAFPAIWRYEQKFSCLLYTATQILIHFYVWFFVTLFSSFSILITLIMKSIRVFSKPFHRLY